MIIIKENEYYFNNWEDVLQTISIKNIHSPYVTKEEFINAISTLKSITKPQFFKTRAFKPIHDLINQIFFYKKDSGVYHSFVDDIYFIACLISELRKNSATKKLFSKDIFSNHGFFTQFLCTCYFDKFMPLVDTEVSNKPLYSDILCKIDEFEIHIHVKDITEQSRESRIDDAVTVIDYTLADRSKTHNLKKRLALNTFEGTPPYKLHYSYWESFAQNLELKPQEIIVNFSPEKGYGNTENVDIRMTFEYRDYSGVFESPRMFSNTKILEKKYNGIVDLLKLRPTRANEIHILIANTEDIYDYEDIKKSLSSEPLGLIIVDIMDFYLQRSPILLPDMYREVEKLMERILPTEVDLTKLKD